MTKTARLQTKPATPKPTISLSRPSILQQTCACGGAPGLTGGCEACSSQRLSRSQGTTNPSTLTDRSSSDHSTPQSQRSPLSGHSFGKLAIAPQERLGIQTKLTIGQPGDRYEQEADYIADQVMRMSAPEKELQRQFKNPEEDEQKKKRLQMQPLQRQVEPSVAEEDEEKKKRLQMKPMSAAKSEMPPDLQERISGLQQGRGQSLSTSERDFFEPRFGQDFSQVRLHTDAQTADLAQAVNARAFTVGRDVVFGAGQYQPRSSEGQHLLAHELTHVLQQSTTSTDRHSHHVKNSQLMSLPRESVLQRQHRGKGIQGKSRRSQQNPATPTLGSCRPVQDDLRPSAPWPALQRGYQARCSSAAADVAGQMGRAAEDILHGRMPHAPHPPDPRSSVDCACALGTPEQAAWAAMPVLIQAGPLAASLYLHFLQGSGTPMTIDVAAMIGRSGGVRRKIRQSIARGGTSGTTRLEQHDYNDRELQFAYGAIDCVQWTALSAGRSWRSDPTTQIRISMLDYYEFHPGRMGVSQCAHAACVELVARGSAKNFWTRGDAVVTWAQLQAP